MTFKSLKLGCTGERLARRHLEKSGYRILESNYRTRTGEIDLIAFDGEILAFIEVKTRTSKRFGHPLEALTSAKCRRISKVALEYLNRKNYHDHPVRFDVVAILTGPPSRVDVVKDAFSLSDGSLW